MPITPFHLGPGYLIKSLRKKHFSFIVFLASQFLMDLETAWNIFFSNSRLHTAFHSYLGSLIPLGLTCLGFICWNKSQEYFKKSEGITFSPKMVFQSGLIGVWSHVLLDSIMHADLYPFWPISNWNPMLGMIPIVSLHLICIASALIGLTIVTFRSVVNQYITRRPKH